MKPLGRFPRQSQRRVHRHGDCSIMGLMKRSRPVDRTGIYNDPTEAAKQQRITYHREGIQNTFPDQDLITSHLMAVEVTEAEAAESANVNPASPAPTSQGGRILFGLISWGAE